MEPSKEQIVSEKSDLTPDDDLWSVWSYKGKHYKIVALLKVKEPEDGNWYQGVAYFPIDSSDEIVYVRFESDFLRKFRRVEGEPDGS